MYYIRPCNLSGLAKIKSGWLICAYFSNINAYIITEHYTIKTISCIVYTITSASALLYLTRHIYCLKSVFQKESYFFFKLFASISSDFGHVFLSSIYISVSSIFRLNSIDACNIDFIPYLWAFFENSKVRFSKFPRA